MSAGQLDITIEQGATFRKTIEYQDDAGQPLDLTDALSVVGQVRPKQPSSSKKSFTMTILSPATDGKILWEMAAEDTADLSTPTVQFYDVEIFWANGDVTRILQGVANISPEVSRE